MIEYFNEDCMIGMARYPDKHFDLAIVDPPYGININHNMGRRKGDKASEYKKVRWDNEIPTEKYFSELERVSKHRIIWGANYYQMPPTKCFIVWRKPQISEAMSFSMLEYAWSSFESTAKEWIGMSNEKDRIHPTQKPVALYKWLLTNYAMENISERDFAVLYKRIVEGKTLEEAGHDMQVTRERVRQVEVRALRRLRAPYTSRRYEALTVKEVSELEESLASATKMNNQLQIDRNLFVINFLKQCELHYALLERLLGRRSQTLQAVTGSMQGLDALIQSIDELGLSTRTYRALKRAGIETVGQLADMSDQQLSAIRNLGVKSKQEAQEKLKAYLDIVLEGGLSDG